MKYHGKVLSNGKFTPVLAKQVRARVDQLKGKNITVEIKRKSPGWNPEQMGYLMVLYQEILDHYNEDGADITLDELDGMIKHDLLKEEVIHKGTAEVLGERVRDKADLDKMELSEYISELRKWAKERRIPTSDPRKQLSITEQ